MDRINRMEMVFGGSTRSDSANMYGMIMLEGNQCSITHTLAIPSTCAGPLVSFSGSKISFTVGLKSKWKSPVRLDVSDRGRKKLNVLNE